MSLPPVVFLPLMRLASDPVDKRHQSHMDDLLARTRAQLRRPDMMDEKPSEDYTDDPQVKDLKNKILLLQEHVRGLCDERDMFKKDNQQLTVFGEKLAAARSRVIAANERLAAQLKEVIAEKEELRVELALAHPQTGYDGPQRDPAKEELRKQLTLKSGLGVHENTPSPFADLKKPAHTDGQ